MALRMVGRTDPEKDTSTLIQHYYRERAIVDIAILTLEQGGITMKLDTGEILGAIDAWGFPKYPSRTLILQPDADLLSALRTFIAQNELLLCEPDCWLGTWIHPYSGQYYLDITTNCPNLDEARRRAIEFSKRDGRRILALYHYERGQTIFLTDDL